MKKPIHSFPAVLLAASLLFAGPTAAREPDHFGYDPKPVVPTPSKPGPGKAPQPPSAPQGAVVRLAKGQSMQVFDAAGTRPASAFYVPASQPSLVQVFVEKKAFRAPVYFLKGLNKGKVTGAVVPREWLDAKGFAPRNIADEARIQELLRCQPIHIIIE